MVAAVPDIYKLFGDIGQVWLRLEELLDKIKGEWLLLLGLEKGQQMRVHFVLHFADLQKGSLLSQLFCFAAVEETFLFYALEEKVFINRCNRFFNHVLVGRCSSLVALKALK